MPSRCTCDPGPEGQHRAWCATNDDVIDLDRGTGPSFAARLRALADDDAAVEAACLAIPSEDAFVVRAVIRALAEHLDGGAR